jgi:hypothetical protein
MLTTICSRLDGSLMDGVTHVAVSEEHRGWRKGVVSLMKLAEGGGMHDGEAGTCVVSSAAIAL